MALGTGVISEPIKMGRQPRSGDFPWLSAHSILNWIGGDTSMVDRFSQKSSTVLRSGEFELEREEFHCGIKSCVHRSTSKILPANARFCVDRGLVKC